MKNDMELRPASKMATTMRLAKDYYISQNKILTDNEKDCGSGALPMSIQVAVVN